MQKYKYVLFAHQTYKSDYGGTSAKTTKTLGEALNVHITLLKSHCKLKLAPSTIEDDIKMFLNIDETENKQKLPTSTIQNNRKMFLTIDDEIEKDKKEVAVINNTKPLDIDSFESSKICEKNDNKVENNKTIDTLLSQKANNKNANQFSSSDSINDQSIGSGETLKANN